MRLFFCLFIFFFSLLFPGCTTANMSGAIGSVIEDGKSLHKVFLRKGTDTSALVDLIKSTVGHDYISPWSDADDELISAQFKATSSQIAKVKDHQSVVRVIKVEFPVQDITTPFGQRSFVEGKYTIWPINGENLDQCNETGAFLKSLLGDQIKEPRTWNGRVTDWGAYMTDDQVVHQQYGRRRTC